MKHYVGVFVSSAIAALSLAGPASAQNGAAGSRDASGRVFTKLIVTMNEPGAFGRPAAGLTFLAVGEDGDRVAIKTNDAGVASAWLAPGSFRFVTPDPLSWDGYAYTWDRVVPVQAGMGIIQLTQDDARSVALAGEVRGSAVRTSEPVSLSSKPMPWKAAVPPTQDLRPGPAPSQVQRASRAAPAESSISSEPVAQKRSIRDGFWFNIGSGYGAISCENCYGSIGGYSGGLSFGGTITPRLLLGVGTTSWYRSEGGVSLVTGTVDARLRFYPSSTAGFFLTTGVGVGTIGADLAQYGSAAEFGAGVVLGLGWDLRVANNMSVTPFWNGFAVATSNADANVGQIGLGLTFH